ncbi:hypothetical protein ACTBCN_005526, partial [Escherichia coli]
SKIALERNQPQCGIEANTLQTDSTRNANSYFSAFTNAAHSNRAAFFFPATFNSVFRACSRFCDVFLPSTLRT